MRINVIGYGTVGKAQAFLLQKLNHEVCLFDPYLFPSVKSPEKNVDMTFVCTPDDVVTEIVQNLVNEHVNGLYVIKSTTLVGTTEDLMKKFGIHIAHNPEFLRENSANEDVTNPDRIIIRQCCGEHGEKLRSLYSPSGKAIFITDPTTGEAANVLSMSDQAMGVNDRSEPDALSQKLGLDI